MQSLGETFERIDLVDGSTIERRAQHITVGSDGKFSIHVSFGKVQRVATELLLTGSRGSATTAVANVMRSETTAGIIVVSWIIAAILQHTVEQEKYSILLGIKYVSSESKMWYPLTYVVSVPLRTD